MMTTSSTITAAQAEQQEMMLGTVASTIALYDESESLCYYEPAVGDAVEKMDAFFSSSLPYEWEIAKQQAELSRPLLGNMARILGSAKDLPADGPDLDCEAYGRLMAQGLSLSILAVRVTDELGSAIARLSGGGGRLK